MVRMNYIQVVQIMLDKLNANLDIGSKKNVIYNATTIDLVGASALKIAY